MIYCTVLGDLINDLEYAYVTIFNSKTQEPLCEGISKVLQKSVQFQDLAVKSFKVFEVEDGSVLIDIYV